MHRLHSMLDRVHAVIGRSRLAARVAVSVRNQCQCIVAHHLSPSDAFEQNGEALVASAIAPRAAFFVDVGANHGLWSRMFISSAPESIRGLLFDPAGAAFDILRGQFSDDPRIGLVKAAVSDQPGEAVIFEEAGGGGSSSLVPGWSNETAQRQPTRVVTLDDELHKRGVSHVDFLKIDVEGYDYRVLMGATRLLSEQRIDVLQFEYNWPWIGAGGTLAAALNLLGKHSYKPYRLRREGLYPVEYSLFGEHFARSNYIAISPRAFDKVRHIIQN